MGVAPRTGKKKGEEGYGQGRAAIAAGDDVLLDEEALVAELLACLEAPDYRPPTLPSVAVELMALSRQPEVDFADVTALIEKDTFIAGRILKVVQSPLYAGASRIQSLHDALVRLGLRTVRDLVMEIALGVKVFRSGDYQETMELLRRHAAATAHACRALCRYTPIEAEYAFMAGLLHDVGIAGTLLALSQRTQGRPPPDLIAIWPAVDRVHARAAELMAGHWELPADLRLALSLHHQVLAQGHAHPLAATVCLADELAHELGRGLVPKEAADGGDELERDCLRSHSGVDRSGAATLAQAREALRLDERQIELVRADARARIAQLS